MPDTVINTISGNLSAENKTFYDRTLLERLKPQLLFHNYGQKRPIPKKEGDTINFRRYAALPANTTALTEGVTPAGSELSISTVTATARQYGDYTRMSDVIDTIGIDDNVTEATEILGDQAGLTLDTVVRNVVCAGSNVLYSSGTSTAEVQSSDKLTGDLIKKAVRALRRQNAKPVEGGFFIGIIHPDTEYDLQSDPLWQDVSKYNGGEAIVAGEIGKIHGVKFVTTSNAVINEGAGAAVITEGDSTEGVSTEGDSTEGGSTEGGGAAGADVYSTMILGANAYGVVEIEGEGKPRIIIKDTKSGGTEDPLEQRATVGWKAFMTAVRLDELSMIRIEHSATA